MTGAVVAQEEAAGQSETDLAKQSQNPVGDLVSLPFQNNTNFGVGPGDDVQNVLNIQPVYPLNLGKINLINRLILPVVYQPEIVPGNGSTFGLADTSYTAFFSPSPAGEVHLGSRSVASVADGDGRPARNRSVVGRTGSRRPGDAGLVGRRSADAERLVARQR